MSDVLVSVAVDAPLYQTLTYLWNEDTAPERGLSVKVPLGKREAEGVIVSATAQPSDFKMKPVRSVVGDERPKLTAKFMDWLEWLADYYVHPIGHVTALAFPPLEKGKPSKKTSPIKVMEQSTAPVLTPEQASTLKNIGTPNSFKVHLVHGVTGSGKTEIYLQLLEQVLKSGKRGLVLVPEISLTPQLLNRFSARFGDKVAVIHSHLTPREKTNQWWNIQSGEKHILVGARSALFCPIPDLGIVIVDEEHEGSYKQEEKLRYHARDAAVMLGKYLNIPVVLGSATPSLETWQNAKAGKYHYHLLKNRVSERPLPTTTVVDLREERQQRKEATGLRSAETIDLPFWLSEVLYLKIIETLEKKEQVALFLNRRGFAQSVLCNDCGFVHRCPNCAITLTLHATKDLVCHYCDYTETKKEICPHCKQGELTALGIGTEQVEIDLGKLFPNARLARADRDEIQSRADLEDLIEKMENRDIDILIGTQMIAKGLDFEHLTLVGVLLADVGFNLPDFRAVERSFQLLTQVSGRSGRHVESGGEVVIQTYNPSYDGLRFSLTNDYESLAKSELSIREELHYPPFGRLAGIRIQGAKEDLALETAERLASRAERLKSTNEAYKDIQILGPAPAPLFKLRGKFRFHLLLKANKSPGLSAFCRQLIGDSKWIPPGTKVQVDVDPINLL